MLFFATFIPKPNHSLSPFCRHGQVRDLRLQPLEAEVVELVVVLEGGLELGLGLGAHLLAAAGPVVDTVWEREKVKQNLKKYKIQITLTIHTTAVKG